MKVVLSSLAAIFLVGAGWFGWQAYRVYHAVSKITGVTVPYYSATPQIPPLSGHQRINFLVLGSDNDKKKEEAHPLTQSMIVVSLDPVNDRVTMLSIPRDFWVPIRRHGWGKIDLANKYGGISLARDTVIRLFHIPIHYYAWVGLNGFIKVIDAFGGVTLDPIHPILDDSYPNDLNSINPYSYKRVFIPAGWQHMSGEQALEYVRSRHGDKIGDFGRSARQQQVLLQLDQKINALNVLTRLPELASDLQDSVRTDLDVFKLEQLEQLSHHIKHSAVQQYVLSVPNYSYYAVRDGQDVVIPEWNKINPLIKRIFAPIPAPRASPTAVPRPTARSSPTAVPPTATSPAGPRPTATPPPTSTPLPGQLGSRPLPGSLFFVQGGNVFELTRDRTIKQLTNTGDVAMPSLSPDGRYLAFVRFSADASDIWVMDLRHPARWRELTHDGGSSDVRNNLWAAWPTWSPNEQQLYFSWDRAKLAFSPSDARPQDLALWSMSPVTGVSSAQQLTQPAQGGGGDTEPVARPHRPSVLLVRWNYEATNQPYSQLSLYDTATRTATFLTQIGGRVLQPAWDASGRYVAFVRLTNGQDEIAVAPVLGTDAAPRLGTRTVVARGPVAQPALSPDGKWVSYLRPEGDGFALYIAPARGGPSTRITEVPGSIDARWHPIWGR